MDFLAEIPSVNTGRYSVTPYNMFLITTEMHETTSLKTLLKEFIKIFFVSTEVVMTWDKMEIVDMNWEIQGSIE